MNYGRIVTKDKLKFYEVADQVFAAISPNRGLSWANAGFINKGKGLVYDTFFDLPHARELKRFCVETGGRAPSYVVCSHYNADHTWGNQEFSDSIIIMHKNAEREHLSEQVEYYDKLVREGDKGGPGDQWLSNEFKGFDLTGVKWQQPDMLVEANTTIRLNEMEVQILNIAPAHSDSDLLMWLPKEKVLFTGDIIFGGAIAYSAQGMKRWNNALRFILNDLKPEIVVPGHGAICGLDFVRESSDYFDTVISEFEKNYDETSSALEIAKRCDISKFLHWLQPQRLFVNIQTLTCDKRGLPMVPNWDYFAGEMLKLREYLDEKYHIPPWDPMSSWVE